tara:strand:- start:695 stop:1183 length:489 start_codon:yes stop_codon:yes gene_type:complete
VGGFKISKRLFLKHRIDDVWKVISSKEALELFHPYCLQNRVVSWGDIKVDEIIYLNGLTFVREFTLWNPNHGFELTIGKRDGKKSKVKWKITKSTSGCQISITVWPYKSNKVPRVLYPLVSFFVVRPMLKKYLSSVLMGLDFYLTNKEVVKKNQFGKHPWFS